jgi:hypothetical protein
MIGHGFYNFTRKGLARRCHLGQATDEGQDLEATIEAWQVGLKKQSQKLFTALTNLGIEE